MDFAPQFDVNAAVDDGGDVFFQNFARQAEGGDADANLAAQIGLAFEDRHVVPVAFQFAGRGQAGRPAADNRHALAAGRIVRRQRLALAGPCRRPPNASSGRCGRAL